MVYYVITRITGAFTVVGRVTNPTSELPAWQWQYPSCFAVPVAQETAAFHPVTEWIDEEEEACQEMYQHSVGKGDHAET
jgi:hypothetical protein